MFELGNWVYWHMGKERTQMRSKLLSKGEGSFQVLVRINDNAYKLAFLGEYSVTM